MTVVSTQIILEAGYAISALSFIEEKVVAASFDGLVFVNFVCLLGRIKFLLRVILVLSFEPLVFFFLLVLYLRMQIYILIEALIQNPFLI